MEIDYQALYEQLMAENEGLRETVAQLKLRPPKLWESITAAEVRHVLTSKLFWAGIAVGIILAFSYGLVPLVTIQRKE